MNIHEAYKTLDLAKGLGMDRVEEQFAKLRSEMREKITSTSNERLKQMYSARLDQIDEAYAVLVESDLATGAVGIHVAKKEVKSQQLKSVQNNKFLITAIFAVVIVGVAVILWILLSENANDMEDEQLYTEQLEKPAPESPEVAKISAASASSSAPNWRYVTYQPENAIDGDLYTWWTPEGKDSPKWLLLKLNGLQEITGFQIHAGSHYPKWTDGTDLFYRNYRIKRMKIEFSDGEVEFFNLRDVDNLQDVFFSKTRKTSYIKIFPLTPFEYKRDGKQRVEWKDYCISEVKLIIP